MLHVSPEAAVPTSMFGVVRGGDVITVDVKGRGLRLEVGEEGIRVRV